MIKTRLLILSYGVVIFMAFCLYKKNYVKKFIAIIVIIILLPLIMNMNIIKDTFNGILNMNSTNDIRYVGKKFYLEEISKSPILGRGFINSLWQNSVEQARFDDSILLNDNGIIAFIYMYGILGLVWIMHIIIKLIFLSWRLYKEENNYIGVLYIIHIIVLSPNIIWWYWSTNGKLIFIIFISLIEKMSEERMTKNLLLENNDIEKDMKE